MTKKLDAGCTNARKDAAAFAPATLIFLTVRMLETAFAGRAVSAILPDQDQPGSSD
jgi:hypothetical protein